MRIRIPPARPEVHRSMVHRPVEASYVSGPCPECSFARMTEDGFRVMVHTMATGCADGKFRNEDAVTLYGYRVVDRDGAKGVIITSVVESSPRSQRTSVTFEEDYAYAIHRDAYLRDVHVNPNYGVLGSCHMHPPMVHRFSTVDLNNFAMYLEDQKIYLAGLFHLEHGELRLTMRVCAFDPDNAGRLLIWNLPTSVSDSEVLRRLPPEGKKTCAQIWTEVSRSRVAPRFVICDADPVPSPQTAQPHPDQDRPADPLPEVPVPPQTETPQTETPQTETPQTETPPQANESPADKSPTEETPREPEACAG